MMQLELRDKVRVIKEKDAFKGQTGRITGLIFNQDTNNICVTFRISTKDEHILYNEEDLIKL